MRFGASKRALNYRGRPPLIKRALPRGAFFDPIHRLEAPSALYSPAKRAIFFYWCPSGARPASRPGGQPRRAEGGVGGDWPACSGLFWRAPPRALAHCTEIFFKSLITFSLYLLYFLFVLFCFGRYRPWG